MGLFVHEPGEAWRVEPTIGVPEIEGADTLAGGAGGGAGGTGAVGGAVDTNWPEAEGSAEPARIGAVVGADLADLGGVGAGRLRVVCRAAFDDSSLA